MGTFPPLLALCAGNSLVTGEFPSRRPVTRKFDVFFDVCLNKRLSKQSWGWWFKTLLRSLWRYCNAVILSQTASFTKRGATCQSPTNQLDARDDLFEHDKMFSPISKIVGVRNYSNNRRVVLVFVFGSEKPRLSVNIISAYPAQKYSFSPA